jgi:hypothetical protein
MKLFRIISIVAFCLLVVFSSSSFMIGIHICSGSVQDVALFTKAQSCANEKKMPPCHKKESKPCCEDKSVIHEGQDIKSDVSKLQLAPVPVIDIDQPLVLIAEVIPSSSLARTEYHNYDPPLRWTDITVEHQVFLI